MDNIQSFSLDSEQYARHRPRYPDGLFLFLSEISEHHDRAWDCATGNGQAAVSCAKYFSRVEATDISAEQIQHCMVHPRVNYSVCPAEQTAFDDSSFDLIVVAQAIHWFNPEHFFREAGRVLKRGGILAVWGYGFPEVEPEIDEIIAKDLMKPIDRFWVDGNRQVMSGYRDLVLPFDEGNVPQTFAVKAEWDLRQLSAYFRTWSAVKRYSAELGHDPVSPLEEKLKAVWKEPGKIRSVQMPLFLKVCRKPAYGEPGISRRRG